MSDARLAARLHELADDPKAVGVVGMAAYAPCRSQPLHRATLCPGARAAIKALAEYVESTMKGSTSE